MKITIKNLQNKIPISPKRIEKVILDTLTAQGIKKSGRISVCFAGDKKIKELNYKYLKKNEPTDVLAFDLASSGDMDGIFADIIVSADRAVRNAAIFKTLPLYEIYLYVIHGVLHILGYDDKDAAGKKIMQEKAERIIKRCLFKRAKQ